jgi:hypothetical protein
MSPELILIVVFFVLVVIFPLIGRISGWSILATFYRFSESFIGECWRFQSAELRWKMGYNNCLTIGTNSSGLFISMFFLFRFGHPQLFIPWSDVSVETKRGFLCKYMEFHFRQAPIIPFRVSERLGQRIMQSGGPARFGKE